MPRLKAPEPPAIIALEKKVEELREEIIVVSATAGLARVSLNDVQRHFGKAPALKAGSTALKDLDGLTNSVNKHAAKCVKMVKALHKATRQALPNPILPKD